MINKREAEKKKKKEEKAEKKRRVRCKSGRREMQNRIKRKNTNNSTKAREE